MNPNNLAYNNPRSIAILMGTYNGELFLNEQIDSLLNQTNQDWTLYIRDDGSTDNTLNIINEYSNKYSQIILINDGLGNLWCMNNFHKLMEYIDSPYYMFCDQDDIWLPNKIDLTFNKIKEVEIKSTNFPIVVYTDLKVVNQKLDIIHESFWKSVKLVPSLLNSFNYLSVYYSAWGCTMLFNKNARDISIPLSIHATMHDSFICMKVVASGGILISIDESPILYRQHSTNAVGAKNYNESYLKSKINNINQIIIDNINKYKMANEIKSISVFTYLYFKLKYILKR